ILEHPDPLLIAEPAAELAGTARINGQSQAFDDEREPRFGEFCRQITRVGYHVDGVLAVRIIASARSPAEHLTHQVRTAFQIFAVDAGIADRLLIGGHIAVDGFGDYAGESGQPTPDLEW